MTPDVPDEAPVAPSDREYKDHVNCAFRLYKAPDMSSMASSTTMDRELRELVKLQSSPYNSLDVFDDLSNAHIRYLTRLMSSL